MMVKVFAILIVLSVTLLGYQNCSQNQTSSSAQPSATATPSAPAQKGSVILDSTAKATEIKIYNIRVNSVSNNYLVDYDSGYFVINLNNFHLFQFSSDGVAQAEYCLSQNYSDSLSEILNASQVCNSGQVSGSEEVCAEAINPPYAELKVNDQQFMLGFESDACGNNKVDICESQKSTQLKSWQQSVLQNLNQLKCQ